MFYLRMKGWAFHTLEIHLNGSKTQAFIYLLCFSKNTCLVRNFDVSVL